MSYEAQMGTSGRQQVWLVELHMRSCGLTFGVGACPATGAKCFNTESTCPVYESFDETNKVYKFIEPVENMPLRNGFIPSLRSVSITPGAIKVGGGLGSRAVASVSFYDHPHSDIGIDKYRDDRDYDPYDRGTFWGKFVSRNKYYLGNLVRIYHGFITNGNITSFNYANAIAMDFYLESISQPSSGTVTLVAKDPLKGADDKRSLAPRRNSGMSQSSITNAVGQVITLLPAGIGDAEYASAGFIALGGESAEFTRTGDALTLITRGVRGTPALAHDAETAIQEVLVYDAETAATIAKDLLETYAEIPSGLINEDEWQAECDSYLPVRYDAFIVKPTAVKDLLIALGAEAPFDIFWNEKRNKIDFRAVKSAPATAPVWSDDSTFLDSDVSISDAPDLRVSTVIINFDVMNPLGDLEDPNNYRQTYVATDTDSVRRYGSQAIKTINSRFISTTNRAGAEFAANVIRSRFKDVPMKLSCDVDLKDGGVWTGDCVFVDHYKIQDETGANAITPYQVTSVSQKGKSLDYELITFSDVPDISTYFPIVLDGELYDLRNPETEMHLPPLTLRGLFNRRFGVPPDSREVRVKIKSTAVLGHIGAASLIILDEEWPAETPIIIEIEDGGYVVGRGGKGAFYDMPPSEYENIAANGGTAIVVDRPITVLNNGTIAAGGGGGGAAFSLVTPVAAYGSRYGGGGGAGFPNGNYEEQWFGGVWGRGSLLNGGGGSAILKSSLDDGDGSATLLAGGGGEDGHATHGIGGGGGGALTGLTVGVGGSGLADGDDGGTPDGGNGAYVYSDGYGCSGGGGGALGGAGGDSGAFPDDYSSAPFVDLYKKGGFAGRAINGISNITFDPLGTGVIIGSTI